MLNDFLQLFALNKNRNSVYSFPLCIADVVQAEVMISIIGDKS